MERGTDYHFEFDEVPLQVVEGTGHRPLFEHWLRRRGDKFAPTYREFAIEDLPPYIIPNCMVIDCAGAYRFRFYGTELCKIHGKDFTGKFLTETSPKVAGAAIADYVDIVRERRRPVAFNAGLIFEHTTLITEVFSLCIPLSDDGINVTAVLERILEGDGIQRYIKFARNGYRALKPRPELRYHPDNV